MKKRFKSGNRFWPLRHRGPGLSTKAKKFSAEARMLLGQMQVAHFVGTDLRTDDLRRVSLLWRRPMAQIGNQRQHQRPVLESVAFAQTPARQVDAQRAADLGDRGAADALAVPIELARHAAVHPETDVTGGEVVPIRLSVSEYFVEHVSFREAL